MIRAIALLLLAAPALAGCALQPLYAGGASGAPAQALAAVEVAPIAGEGGWLLRQALGNRLHGAGQAATARYRLNVTLDDNIAGFGVRADDSITRERRTLRARWQLVDTQGTTLVDATSGSDMGIDVVGSEYATIAAERTALERLTEQLADQIVTRIAIYARNEASAPSAPR